MGMSSYILGFKPPDDKWKQMKAIWDSCEKVEIEPPEEVYDFFSGNPPDDAEVEIDLEKTSCCKKYDDGDMREGIEINVDEIPRDVKIIRFVNSY